MSRPTTELTHLFRQLKAPAAARALPKLADRARQEEWSLGRGEAAPARAAVGGGQFSPGGVRARSRSLRR
jgi:hypothetical protein